CKKASHRFDCSGLTFHSQAFHRQFSGQSVTSVEAVPSFVTMKEHERTGALSRTSIRQTCRPRRPETGPYPLERSYWLSFLVPSSYLRFFRRARIPGRRRRQSSAGSAIDFDYGVVRHHLFFARAQNLPVMSRGEKPGEFPYTRGIY